MYICVGNSSYKQTKFYFMEVTIYSSLDARSQRKRLTCFRVANPDAFSFEKCIDVFRCIYGSNVVIEFVIV